MATSPHVEPTKPWWKELSRYQWTVLLVAWLGWVFDVFDTSPLFLAKQSIVKEFLGAAAYDKGGAGPVVEGKIMDRLRPRVGSRGPCVRIMADPLGAPTDARADDPPVLPLHGPHRLVPIMGAGCCGSLPDGPRIGGEWACGNGARRGSPSRIG